MEGLMNKVGKGTDVIIIGAAIVDLPLRPVSKEVFDTVSYPDGISMTIGGDAINEDTRIVELRRSVRMAAESKLENGVIDATDLLRKITDETSAMLNRSTHEIELLQATYRLKHTLNQ